MAQPPTDVRPLHILIPTELHDRLRQMATARDRSVAAETRQAIEARLSEFEPETPQQDRDSSKAAA